MDRLADIFIGRNGIAPWVVNLARATAEIMVLAEDVLGCKQTGFDRVIRVVVPECAVATDDLDILETVDEILDRLEVLLVTDHVRGIRAGRAHGKATDYFVRGYEVEVIHEVAHGLFNQLLLGHIPDRISK